MDHAGKCLYIIRHLPFGHGESVDAIVNLLALSTGEKLSDEARKKVERSYDALVAVEQR